MAIQPVDPFAVHLLALPPRLTLAWARSLIRILRTICSSATLLWQWLARGMVKTSQHRRSLTS